MLKMTLKEMYARHQELWFWLANNPERRKIDYPGWGEDYEGNDVESECFACQWNDDHNLYCWDCPLDWPGDDCRDLLEEWTLAPLGSDHRVLMADLIANVPLKKGLR